MGWVPQIIRGIKKAIRGSKISLGVTIPLETTKHFCGNVTKIILGVVLPKCVSSVLGPKLFSAQWEKVSFWVMGRHLMEVNAM